jgi:hypothetical protein
MKRANTIFTFPRLLVVFILFVAFASSAVNLIEVCREVPVVVTKKTKGQDKSDAEFPFEEKETESRPEEKSNDHLVLIYAGNENVFSFTRPEPVVFEFKEDADVDPFHGLPIYLVKRSLLL